MSHQPASLPSSLTHPTQPRLDLPGPLPEPLLPLSSVSNDGSQAVLNNQNPFLWGPMQLEKFLDKKGNAVRLCPSKYNLKCRIAAPRTCMKTLFLVILYCGIIFEPYWFWFCSSLQVSLLFLLAKMQLQVSTTSGQSLLEIYFQYKCRHSLIKRHFTIKTLLQDKYIAAFQVLKKCSAHSAVCVTAI